MRAVIIGNGEVSNETVSLHLRETDTVICCDGGLNFAFKEGIMPHFIIGDFDSVSPQILDFFERKNTTVKRYEAKKDFTDMELCIDFASDLDIKEILIFGGTGNRFDHTLANAHILIRALNKGVKACLIDDNNIIHLINDEIILYGKEGNIVSLLPLSEKVIGLTTKGLEYELCDFQMNIGTSRGISNVMLGEQAKVSIEKGYLFVILAKD